MNSPQLFEIDETRNAILASLSGDEAQRLRPHLREVEMALGQVFSHLNDAADAVIFPEAGMISIILDSAQQVGVEIGVVGHEGVWGVLCAINDAPRMERSIVQATGWGWQMDSRVLREEFTRGGCLQKRLLSYFNFFHAQAAVAAMCNRLHTVEERLSRWLLIVRGGAGTDEFDLSPEFLACMLGTRLSGVPLALGVLQQAGLIAVDGRRITLLDVDGLHQSACECHALLDSRLQLFVEAGAPCATHGHR